MFSIYSHVRNKNRGRQILGYDSDEQTPTPPPTLPTLKPVEPPVKPRVVQATSLLTQNNTASQNEQRRNSAPTLTQPESLPPPATTSKNTPAKASEPSENEEEEAVEARASEELAGSQPNPGRWVLDALKKEPSLVEPTIQPNKSSATPKPSKKDRIFNDHRTFLLGIKRSLRGRVISNAPIGDRSKKSTRYLSPYTLEDLQESYKKSPRTPNPVAPATPDIPASSGSVSPPPKRQQPRTPEPKKRQQRPKSTSTRRQSVRNASVKKPTVSGRSKGPSSAIANKLANMLQDPDSPDKDIAPLVSNWTKQLVSKADKAEQAIKEKDGLIESLEKENEGLETKLSDAQSKVKKLQTRVSNLEPDGDEVSALKAQVQQLTADKAAERLKVQNLNIQLSTLLRQSKTEKKQYEKSMSRQASMGGDDELKDLKANYEALDNVAREVVRDCDMMAGENFGAPGKALLKLKKYME